MGMTLEEARELLISPIWPYVRDNVLAGKGFAVHPSGDLGRLAYLDEPTRLSISHWCDATARIEEWKRTIDGKDVRRIREEFSDVYPEIFRYESYFAKCKNEQERLWMILKIKFPKVLEMINC